MDVPARAGRVSIIQGIGYRSGYGYRVRSGWVHGPVVGANDSIGVSIFLFVSNYGDNRHISFNLFLPSIFEIIFKAKRCSKATHTNGLI